MKKVLTLIALMCMCACTSQQTKILDEEHRTFFINGISAIDGYDAVSKSLQDIGFVIDKDGPIEVDLTLFGQGFSYSVNYYSDGLTKAQASRLTAGLFDDLPSKIVFDENWKWRVYLNWYRSGEIAKCIIDCDDGMILLDEDAIEVNKRLAAMFPHSKVSNSNFGYKTYYDDNGVEVYFPNKYWLEIEKSKE